MKRFPEFVARQKVWPVFLLLMFPFFVLGVESLTNAISQFASTQPQSGQASVSRFGFVKLLFMPLWLTWVVALGVAANRRVQPSLRGTIWIAVGSALYAVVYNGYVQLEEATRESLLVVEVISTLQVPLLTLELVSVLYPAAFAAKNVVQLTKPTSFSLIEWWVVFTALLCFPIGVWLLQPWANKLIGETNKNV